MADSGEDAFAEFAEPPPSSSEPAAAAVDSKDAAQDGRTARWWRWLGLPSDAAAVEALRESYFAKLKMHVAGKADDPLTESVLEAACAPARADLAAGCGFPASHPLALAATTGDLANAELVSKRRAGRGLLYWPSVRPEEVGFVGQATCCERARAGKHSHLRVVVTGAR
jgi:hypothetical protein